MLLRKKVFRMKSNIEIKFGKSFNIISVGFNGITLKWVLEDE